MTTQINQQTSSANYLPRFRAMVAAASGFSAAAHNLQKRDYGDVPYIVHPREVAQICASHAMPMEVIIAAFLHDVLEDTAVDEAVILREFGEKVTHIVKQVTNPPKPEGCNRADYQVMVREHLAIADANAQSLKVADIIANTRDIHVMEPKRAVKYMAEKRALLAVLTKAGPKLLAEANEIVERYYATKH